VVQLSAEQEVEGPEALRDEAADDAVGVDAPLQPRLPEDAVVAVAGAGVGGAGRGEWERGG